MEMLLRTGKTYARIRTCSVLRWQSCPDDVLADARMQAVRFSSDKCRQLRLDRPPARRRPAIEMNAPTAFIVNAHNNPPRVLK